MKTRAVPQQVDLFRGELYLAKRLQDHGAGVFAGITDPAIRKTRMRLAILDSRLDMTIVGRNLLGKAETYQQLFERIYGERLMPTKGKKTNAESR